MYSREYTKDTTVATWEEGPLLGMSCWPVRLAYNEARHTSDGEDLSKVLKILPLIDMPY